MTLLAQTSEYDDTQSGQFEISINTFGYSPLCLDDPVDISSLPSWDALQLKYSLDNATHRTSLRSFSLIYGTATGPLYISTWTTLRERFRTRVLDRPFVIFTC
jgi:hypothetical protein